MSTTHTGMADLGLSGSKWEKSGTYQYQFSINFGSFGPDPPENCHLTFFLMPKMIISFKKNLSFGNFFTFECLFLEGHIWSQICLPDYMIYISELRN